MLGVATLIIVMSVMNGFREDFTNVILGINSHISVFPYEREFMNYDKAIKIIKQNNNVKSVIPVVENQVMILGNENTNGAIIKGVELKDLKTKEQIYNKISNIDFDDDFKNNSILLGQSLAIKLRVSNGDTVKIISPETNSTILGTIPRMKTYKVVGTFSSGMYDYDVGVAFIVN